MNGNFEKIKKRALIAAIIKSAVIGISAGLFAVGVLLLPLKLQTIHINAGYYVLSGVGVALLFFAVLFFLLRPSDKKLAKTYDEEYALNERVQTMVAFRGEQGAIIEMQRRDTDEKLGNLSSAKLRISRIWQYALAAVLALAMFIAAVAVPYKTEPVISEPPEEKFNLTEWQESSMNQLITDVMNSELDSVLKTNVSTSLSELLECLREEQPVSDMVSSVTACMEKINTAITDVNTYKTVCIELNRQKTDGFVYPIIKAIPLYRGVGVNLAAYDQVQQRAASLEQLIGTALEKNIVNSSDSERKKFATTLADGLGNTIVDERLKIVTALDNLDDENDLFCVALQTYSEGLGSTRELIENNYGDTNVQKQLDLTFSTFIVQLTAAVRAQSYQCLMGEFVRAKLSAIFPDAGELPYLNLDVEGLTSGSGSTNPDGDGNKGGAGSGDTLYPSNDQVFDPDTGERKPYGGLLTDGEYYARVMEQLANGGLPEELGEAIRKYFDILLSGPQTEDNAETGD